MAAKRKAAERQERKRIARELRLKFEAERRAAMEALEMSKANVRQMREEVCGCLCAYVLCVCVCVCVLHTIKCNTVQWSFLCINSGTGVRGEE